jgi:hypothetical protein
MSSEVMIEVIPGQRSSEGIPGQRSSEVKCENCLKVIKGAISGLFVKSL